MAWRCARCETPQATDDPPCEDCGYHEFERVDAETDPKPAATGGYVWVCSDCGRQHQKHSPPCSRCGNHSLDRRDLASVEDPLSDVDTRWRDVFELRYVAAYVAVGVLLVVLALGFVGVYDLPGTAAGPPPLEDVRGDGTTAGGHDLATVERRFVEEVGADRDATDGALAREDDLASFATDYNQRMVAAAFGDRDRPDRCAVARSHDLPCDGLGGDSFRVTYAASDVESIRAFDAEEALATDLYEFWVRNGGGFDDASVDRIGVDVHAVEDERVFVTVAAR